MQYTAIYIKMMVYKAKMRVKGRAGMRKEKGWVM
jgi:hypothetical protein